MEKLTNIKLYFILVAIIKHNIVYIERTIENVIKRTSDTFPVVLVIGPRQVGKTTVFKNCKSIFERRYVSLDDLDNRMLAKEDPKLFLEKYSYPLLIDEVQYAPELFPYIKMNVDNENKNGMYWLTGSQQFSLMKNISESLAGRVGILNLQGFSQREKYNLPVSIPFLPTNNYIKQQKNFEINIHELYNIIWKGSFPRIFSNPNIDWYTFYYSYIQTYIERDIREMVAVDEILFLKFITILASRTGQELNYASIANDINISQPTVKTWISLLKMSGIIYLLQPYYSNLSNRLIKTPKLYFLDTGLVAYLTKYTTPDILENGAINGAILETYVVSEILKSYWHNGLQPNVYFYRDKEKREIDLIIEENDKLYPIEIKRKSNPDKNDIKNFDVLKKFNKEIGEGAVICLSNDELPITRDVIKIPVSYL